MGNNELITQLLADLKDVLINNRDDPCTYCLYNHECEGKKCDCFMKGEGGINVKTGEKVDYKWTCMDFDYGTCKKLEETPCNECMSKPPYFSKWMYKYIT